MFDIGRSAMLTSYCPNCEKEVVVYEDESRGTVFCNDCHTVLDDSGIVDDQVSYNAQSKMEGQLVKKGSTGGGLSESREVTVRRATERIRNIARKLRLTGENRMIELAVNLYKACLDHGHTRGRPGDLVSAACLYIICRRQKTPHMLLDFSEALQEDIFRIGRTFFQLITKLNCTKDIPLVEPWLYVERFANELNFEENQLPLVIETSMKLIAGMKKDWIQTGRRPTSVCAAALLLAARIHNCPRTKEEIAKVMRICEGTLLKRLDELEHSNVGKMTVEEINSLPKKLGDDTQETRSQDLQPPCVQDRENQLTRKKKKKKRKKKKKKMNEEEDENDEFSEEEEEEEEETRRANYKMKDLDQLIGEDPTLLEKYQKNLETLANCQTFVQMSNDYLVGRTHEKAIQEQSRKEREQPRRERKYVDEELDEEELDGYIITDQKVIDQKTKAWKFIYGDFMKDYERKKRERMNLEKERERRKSEKKQQTKKRKRVSVIGATAKESASMMLRKKMSEKNLSKIGLGGLFSFGMGNDDEIESNENENYEDFFDDDLNALQDDDEEEDDETEPPRKKRKTE